MCGGTGGLEAPRNRMNKLSLHMMRCLFVLVQLPPCPWMDSCVDFFFLKPFADEWRLLSPLFTDDQILSPQF